MVNNLVFRWPKPLFFMVLGAHGIVGSKFEYEPLFETIPWKVEIALSSPAVKKNRTPPQTPCRREMMPRKKKPLTFHYTGLL